MHLDSLRPQDLPQPRFMAFKKESQALRSRDIEGASPVYPQSKLYVTGPPVKESIPGSTAATLYPELNRAIDLPLTTCDIRGAQPRSENSNTRRHRAGSSATGAPLKVERAEGASPRGGFLAEPQDIFRAQPHSENFNTYRSKARNPNESRDIELSLPSARHRMSSFTPRDPFKVVEKAGERILSSKCNSARFSHPLDPVYNLPSGTTHPMLRAEQESNFAPSQAGPIEGAAPRRGHGQQQAAGGALRQRLEERFCESLPCASEGPADPWK